MISFRYHIVSIVAVFLALALGIVIGTTALAGPVTRDLRKQVDDGTKQRDSLASQVKYQQGQLDDASDFASTYGQKLVAGTLTGQNVIEVVLPGVPSDTRSGVDKQLAAAGATVTGRVLIGSDYLDSSRSTGIVSLATGESHPLSWTAPQGTSDGGKIGGSLLAWVLLGKGQASDLTTVLGGFSELHMLSQDGGTLKPATNVVVLAHGAPSSEYGGSAQQSIVDYLAQYKGKVVVAGDSGSTKGNGVIGLVRNSDTRDTASTVDDADTPFGQVATALALAGTIKGDTGQYGTGSGAEALFPQPGN